MGAYEKTSVKLGDGGDTHAHYNPDGTTTVTTQLPGGVSVHDTFDSSLNHQDTSIKTGD